MKIVVTGANGYIGLGVIKKLLDDGHEVIAADYNTQKCDKRAKRIDCDLFSIADPYSFWEKPDVILHLAWRNGFIHNSDSHFIDYK